MITIYHNPRCSKSRGALERAQQFAAQHAIELQIVDYQNTPPSLAQLRALHQTLQSEGAVAVRDMLRDGEEAFTTLHLGQADDEALFAALAAHPVLLQRPIVSFNGRAIIARPPELVDRILAV
jgi:arsenate reductase